MEDKPRDAKSLADFKSKAKEEVGNDTKRKAVIGIFHGLEELVKGVLEVFGGHEKSGVEINGGKLGGVFAALWEAVDVGGKGKFR